MKAANLMAGRVWTLAVVIFLFGGVLAQGSKMSAYLDGVIDANSVIGRILVSTGVVAKAENARADDNMSPLAVETWSGAAGDNDWTSNGNWEGIGGAGADDDLVFPNAPSGGVQSNNNFTANTRFRSIRLESTLYAITGNPILLTAGISNIGTGGTAVPSFAPNITLDANQTFSTTTKDFILNGVINLGGHTLNVSTGTGEIFFNNNLTGTGNLNLAGNATIIGNGSAFGATEIDSGALSVNSPGVLGNVNLNGGILQGTGTVGAITANAATGGVINPGLNNGSQAGNVGVLTTTGSTVLNAATTLEIHMFGTLAGSNLDLLRANGSNINLGGAALQLIVGVVPNVGNQFNIVVQQGAGDLTGQFAQGAVINSSGHIFSIAYTVNGVVLTYQGSSLTWDGSSSSSWGTAANWDSNVAPASTSQNLDLVFPAGAQNLTNSNNVGGLNIGSIQLTGPGYQIFGNPINLSEGIADTSNGNNTFDPDLTFAANQTFSKSGTGNLTVFGDLNMGLFGLSVNGTGTMSIPSNILGTNAGGGHIAINKTGTGTLGLSGSGNNYLGETRVNAGTLIIGSNPALGSTVNPQDKTIVASGSTLRIGTVNYQSNENFDLNGAGVSAQGAIFTSSCTGCILNGDVTLLSNSTINIEQAGNKLSLNGRTFSGATLTKAGAGTLVFNDNPNFVGTKAVNGGTIIVNTNHLNSPVSLNGGTIGGSGTIGALSGSGTVAPGASPGILTVNGAADLSSATLNIELNGPTAGTQHDRLVVTGTTNLSSANLTGSLGFNPNGGQQFTIIQSTGAITGQFAQGTNITIGGRQFTITYNANSVVLTASGGTRAPVDFDGDGKTDISIFRPALGEWWYQRSSDGQVPAAQFGQSTDRITPGDFTGDGKTDIAFWRPSTGFWFVLRSEDSSFFSFPFGADADVPVPADYDGDGKTDPAVFRPSNATWFIARSSDNGTTIVQFGIAGDKPVVGDYDGDRKADIAIFRPGPGEWWYLRSSDGSNGAVQFGTSTDKLVQGDYTGDGKTDIAFWRPSTGFWFILRSEDSSFFAFPFGTTGDLPTLGDYDGDGKFDAAVFRASNATWFVQRSTAGTLIQQFGLTGDAPVPSAFVP